MNKGVKDRKTDFVFLLGIGIISVIIMILFSYPLRNEIEANIFRVEVGDSIGTFNGQRISQLGTLITLYDKNPNNDESLAEDIDLHGQLFYLVLAKIGAWLNWHPVKLFYMTQYMAMVGLALIYPFIMYFCVKSIKMVMASSIAILGFSYPYLFGHLNDSYWATPWCILFAVPLLVELWKTEYWGKKEAVNVVLLMIISCFANVVRPSSAIGIFVSLIIISIFRILKRKNGKVAVLCMVSYGLVYILAEKILLGIWNFVFKKNIPNSASPWHAIWCGLGWKENPYGFVWNDIEAYAKARSIQPDVTLYSEKYFEILKNECLLVLREDPIFFVRVYLSKFFEAMEEIWLNYYGIIFVFLILVYAMLYVVKQKNGLKYKISCISMSFCLLGIINMICGVAQGIVGAPTTEYILGGYAGQSFILIGGLFEIGNLGNFIKNKEFG